jgi:hypothetical protein
MLYFWSRQLCMGLISGVISGDSVAPMDDVWRYPTL